MVIHAAGQEPSEHGQKLVVGKRACIASMENLNLHTVAVRYQEDATRFSSIIFGALANAEITVFLSSTGPHGQAVSFLVPALQTIAARAAVDGAIASWLHSDWGAGEDELDYTVVTDVSMICLVSELVGASQGLCARFYQAIATCDANIIATSASQLALACAVEARHTASCVQAVHDIFSSTSRPPSPDSADDKIAEENQF
jgi:aspartokinase